LCTKLVTNIPHPNIFLYVYKCPHDGHSCSSFITICAFVIVKHLPNVLSWPILYNSSFSSVKGFYSPNHYLLSWLVFTFVVHIMYLQFGLFSRTNLHHLIIHVLYKTYSHLWFD
jgi:hypothetical protein